MVQVATQTVTTGSFDGNQASVPASHVVNSGEGLLVGILLEVTDAGKEVLSVIWDQPTANQALTKFADFNPTHGKLRLEIWRHTGPTPKTADVQITIDNSNAQKVEAVAVSMTNMDSTTPLSDKQTDEGATSPGSVAVTQGADDLGFCIAGWLGTASNFVPGGGEAELADFGSNFDMWAASEDGAGSVTLSWTHGGGAADNSTLGCVIEAAPSGVSIPIAMYHHTKHNLA